MNTEEIINKNRKLPIKEKGKRVKCGVFFYDWTIGDVVKQGIHL
jgi:hypothetical protein